MKTDVIDTARSNATSDRIVVPLAPDCTLRGAVALREQLLPLLAEPRAVAIDAAAVASVDFSGLQVLLAFVQTRRGANLPVGWLDPPAVIDAAARRLGIARALELRGVEGGIVS